MLRFPETVVVACLALALALLAPQQVSAEHNVDEHSPNMSLLTNFAMPTTVSDIAFWKGRAAISTGYDTANPKQEGFHLVDISRPAAPELLSSFYCPAAGYDVGIWEDLVFLSVTGEVPVSCDGDGAKGTFAGIRIVSIADPKHPVQIATVRTCGGAGSHTHTVVPDLKNKRVFLYSSGGCIDIVEVPLREPAKARVVHRMQETVCHDLTVLMERRLAGVACSAGDAQLWDISDPAEPTVLSRFVVPLAQNYHSTLFSEDGRTLVVGDENLHGIATGSCHTGPLQSLAPQPHGALHFFDISKPRTPEWRSYFQAQHPPVPRYCSAHQFNLVPRRDGRDVLAAGWYGGGAVLVDFTNPGAPKQIGHYQAAPDDGERASINYSAYFYRGHVWATNMAFIPGGVKLFSSTRGLDVLSVDDPAVDGAVWLNHLNAQTQEALPPPP